MKLLHLADLHLGKSIGNYSLIEDQKYALDQVLDIIDDEAIDVVMIAGDIFDTLIPGVDALRIYSDFIEEIIFKKNKKVLAISGNHDSSKRLDINNKFFKAQNYYMVGEYQKEVLSLEDEYGKVNFYMIPYISINQAKILFDESIDNFTDVYKHALASVTYDDRNVLITHCYANSIAIEEDGDYKEGQKPLTIGGSDAMDAHLFLNFDYVALGHLHGKHFVVDPKIRYAGTFMPYAFDETNNKSVTIVEMTDEVSFYDVPIKPLREFKTFTGTFDQILREESSDDYIKVVLKDNQTIENAMAKLKEKFPHIVAVIYENRGVFEGSADFDIDLSGKTSLDLFKEFYKFKMDDELTDDELEVLKKVME